MAGDTDLNKSGHAKFAKGAGGQVGFFDGERGQRRGSFGRDLSFEPEWPHQSRSF